MLQEQDMLEREPDDQVFQGIPEDEIEEEIHVYMVRKPIKRPWFHWQWPRLDTILNACMLVLSLVLLSGFVLLPGTPIYHVQTIVVPAHFSTVTDSAQTAIQATGTKEYPASKAYGSLTIYNASFLNQSLPSGFMVESQSGIQVITEISVFIPANNPPSDGVATVQAQALIAGSQGNIQAGAINAVYGSSLYIRNLESFTGGHDAYTKQYATNQDKTKAFQAAKQQVQVHQLKGNRPGLLVKPCSETDKVSSTSVSVSLTCQYASYKAPKNAQVLYARLSGKNVMVTTKTIVLPS